MKATGIVRRIDGLGRIVVPKEIRKTLHIRDGDPMEIYTSADGSVIFKKYSPLCEIGEYSKMFAGALAQTAKQTALVCDRETVVSASPDGKKYEGKRLSDELLDIIENRRPFEGSARLLSEVEAEQSCIISPIITNGDIAGACILLSDKGEDAAICRLCAELIAGMLE